MENGEWRMEILQNICYLCNRYSVNIMRFFGQSPQNDESSSFFIASA